MKRVRAFRTRSPNGADSPSERRGLTVRTVRTHSPKGADCLLARVVNATIKGKAFAFRRLYMVCGFFVARLKMLLIRCPSRDFSPKDDTRG